MGKNKRKRRFALQQARGLFNLPVGGAAGQPGKGASSSGAKGRRHPQPLRYIFYDAYRHLIETRTYIHESLITTGVLPGTPEYEEMRRRSLSLLSRTQVRVLDIEVCRLVLDLMSKAGATPVPYIPYPKYPMWVEFDGASIGDTLTQFNAVWAFPHVEGDARGIVFQLLDSQGGAKDLFVSHAGAWQYYQGGPCSNTSCIRAGDTREGETFAITGKECGAPCDHRCTCAQASKEMTKMVFLIGHLLHSVPVTKVLQERVVSRELSLPRNFHDRQEVERFNSSHPRYIRLSLTTPRIEVRGIKPTPTRSARVAEERYLEIKDVAGSWRALIPGEGKPWKEFQLFYVDSYQRSMPVSDQPIRYLIQR